MFDLQSKKYILEFQLSIHMSYAPLETPTRVSILSRVVRK